MTVQESPKVQISRDEYEQRLSSSDEGLLSLDAQGRILQVSPYVAGLLAYSREELRGKPLWELSGRPESPAARSAVSRLHRTGYLRHDDLPLMTRDGVCLEFEYRRLGWVEEGVELVGCRLDRFHFGRDREQDAGQDEERMRMCYRRHFAELADLEIQRSRREGRPLSLLSIALDRMRSTSGTERSELALRGFARACEQQLRATDIVARVSEARFVALLPGTDAKGALRTAERLRTAVANMDLQTLSGRMRRTTCSIGVVTTRSGSTTYATLRSRADAKCDEGRSQGGNRVMR